MEVTRAEFTIKHLKDQAFTSKHLKDRLAYADLNLGVQVKYDLDHFLHWTLSKSETKWFIDLYEKSEAMNHLLLELAMFNPKDLSRWWTDGALREKLSFIRDGLIRPYVWAVGIAVQPQYSYYRKMTIDDIHEVYGNLAGLKFLPEAFERRDTKEMERQFWWRIINSTILKTI